MPNAEARSWWDDVQHLRPGATEPGPQVTEPRREAIAKAGLGDDRPAGSPRARRRPTGVEADEPRRRTAPAVEADEPRRRMAPAVEADTPRRLTRSDAAGFASAFDLDGAFGTPGRRQADTSRTIVLERDGDDLAGVVREREADLPGSVPGAVSTRDLGDLDDASGADFFDAGTPGYQDVRGQARDDSADGEPAAHRPATTRADRAARRRSGERRSHRASVHGERRARRASFAESVAADGGDLPAVVAEDLLDPAPEAERGADRRRTVQITGRTVPAPRLRLHEIEQRRPQRRAVDRVGARPDRIAMWAVMLGLFLVLLAATSGSARAATPTTHRPTARVTHHIATRATHRVLVRAARSARP